MWGVVTSPLTILNARAPSRGRNADLFAAVGSVMENCVNGNFADCSGASSQHRLLFFKSFISKMC